ncbi:hypothetical protein ACO0LC_28875 [Undibacterium sp. JH2W]|uniref:hypothetical protein n=1 Tax=Undibacterium sp. JH2W TaxID=3413037 RepID=UPI003BF40507
MSDRSRQELMTPIGVGQPDINQREEDCGAWICGEARLVAINGGTIKLCRAQVGDIVLACCELTGELRETKIVNIQTREDVPTWLLYCQGYYGDVNPDILTLEAAAALPVFVLGKGWTRMMDLKSGEKILSFNNRPRCIANQNQADAFLNRELTALGVNKTGRKKKLYHLELADTHSYSVGHIAVWVHDGVDLDIETAFDATASSDKEDLFSIGGCGNQQYFQGAKGEVWETDSIYPGFELNSRCEKTGELISATVQHRIFHEDVAKCCIWYICDGDERNVTVSCGQEILVKGRGWTRAVDIEPNDLLESGDDAVTSVLSIQTDWDGDPMDGDCYSFIVTGNNTFCFGLNSELCLRGVALK